MTDKAVVFSVIFPGNLPYFGQYLDSLAAQSEKKFDVFLILDGVYDLSVQLEPYRDHLSVYCRNASGTIAAVRQAGIAWLKEADYQHIIFADTDDVFSVNRVSVCRAHLESCEVVVNDLIPFNDVPRYGAEGYWANRIQSGDIFSNRRIERCNFVGLGNTSVRRDVLQSLAIPEDITAVDWFLFYQFLDGARGKFVHDGAMHYRQHNSNTAGLQTLTHERLQHIAKVKAEHYRHLTERYKELDALAVKAHELWNMLTSDKSFLTESLNKLNNGTHYFWWEETEYLYE